MESRTIQVGSKSISTHSEWQTVQRCAQQLTAARRARGQFVSIRDFVLHLGFEYIKEEWQLEDLEKIIQAAGLPIKEILVLRARNGSKTEDMILLGLYLAYLGYDVIFFAAQESQIKKPQQYLAKFILYFL